MSDIISDIIETIREHVATVTPEVARNVEDIIRKQWGGERAYIAKCCVPIASKRQTINNELRAGYSIVQIEQRHEIPRSTIYRLINKKHRG